jgi:hypothetical protein
VVKVQSGYKVQPLSAFLKQPAPPPAPVIDFPKANAELVKQNFFSYFDFALQFAPAGPEEVAIRAKLASIGIGPGKTFEMKDLSRTQSGRVAGHEAGRRKDREASHHRTKNINGWKVGSLFVTAASTVVIG